MNRNLSVNNFGKRRKASKFLIFGLRTLIVSIVIFLYHSGAKDTATSINEKPNYRHSRRLLAIEDFTESTTENLLDKDAEYLTDIDIITTTTTTENSLTEDTPTPEPIFLLAVNDTNNETGTTTDYLLTSSTTEIYEEERNETTAEALVAAPPDEFQKNCTTPAITEFPSDGFTRDQRRHGAVIIHILISCYCFWILAIVCDDYFVPAIESMCHTFEIKEDVIGATFMAAATSSPELFINCVGTFVTKGDIGIGTIVGSAVFNILAVPACCGLFAGQVVALDWWPVSRDCLVYCFAVLGLIGILHDGKVMWYEGLILVIAYFMYITVMYCNDAMARKARKVISRFRRRASRIRPYKEVTEISPLLGPHARLSAKLENGLEKEQEKQQTSLETISDISAESTELADDPWTRGESGFCFFVLRWPITLLLWLTIPDCRKHPRLRLLTFFFSVVWIGAISYLVAFLITVVGDTIDIPDSVMGLTILAAGMSVPEAVSSVIVTNQGHGAMGISNSIGSNTFDILLCLGLPWFIKAYFVPAKPDELWVELNSNGLTYSAVSLLTTLFGLYLAFALNKFRLDWKIGLACTLMYACFLVFATLVEMNVFFDVNLPVCPH